MTPGTGMLDLPRMIRTLGKDNFADRKATHLAAALQLVKSHPPKQPVPEMQGKPVAQQLAEEEANNRQGLAWMQKNCHA